MRALIGIDVRVGITENILFFVGGRLFNITPSVFFFFTNFIPNLIIYPTHLYLFNFIIYITFATLSIRRHI